MGKRTTKIINLVLKKKEEINSSAEAANKNKDLAIAAIIGGIRSQAWKTYMQQFVSNDDPDQLALLTTNDGNQNLNIARAYLVANAICGEGTREHFDENVKSIDGVLETTNCDPKPDGL
jgi:hypothetical protein